MNTALQTVDTDTGEIIDAEVRDLVVSRPPDEVLEQARTVALALKQRIDNKAKPVKFNGETYLEFEDWQVLANFYGLSAKVIETKYVEYGTVKGFEARAVAIKISTGQEVSAAEALCLNDEPNWSRKPLYQLKSMAQTRACSKTLRNVLAWVVVLAGYKPTPAEEMQGVIAAKPQPEAYFPSSAPEADAQEPPPWLNEEEESVKQLMGGKCTFGKNKGKFWSEMTVNQLKWYKEQFEAQIEDPSKAQYKSKNEQALQEVLDALEAK